MRGRLENAKTRLAAAPKGQRNNALNNEALGLGHLAHLGAFQESEVLSAFMAACTENGLLADSGIKAVHATFWSGWNKGLTEPRELADRPMEGRPPPLRYGEASQGADAPPPPPPHPLRQARSAASDKFDGPPQGEGFQAGTGEVIPDLGIWSPSAADEPILPRGWLLGNIFARGYLSSLIAAGGTGKTARARTASKARVAGRSTASISSSVPDPLRQPEDDAAELNRRVKAAMMHHRGRGRRLALPATPLPRPSLASLDGGQVQPGLLGPALGRHPTPQDRWRAIPDPFIKTHAVEENANSQTTSWPTCSRPWPPPQDCAIDAFTASPRAPWTRQRRPRPRGFRLRMPPALFIRRHYDREEAETRASDADRRFIRMTARSTSPARRAKWFKLIGSWDRYASRSIPMAMRCKPSKPDAPWHLGRCQPPESQGNPAPH
jgi:hypothetical protein